jgi:hypothetical protein
MARAYRRGGFREYFCRACVAVAGQFVPLTGHSPDLPVMPCRVQGVFRIPDPFLCTVGYGPLSILYKLRVVPFGFESGLNSDVLMSDR